MAIIFYDLMGRDGRNFSPFCWRARMALAHKGQDIDHRGTAFTAIKDIGGTDFRTVPVIEDCGRLLGGSLAIAEYLEGKNSDQPSLFGGAGGMALCNFVHNWTGAVVHAGVVNLVLLDIFNHVCAEDRDYFRASREKMFGNSLEDVQAGREDRVESFQATLQPLRMTVKRQEFLGGVHPNYADYIVFGAFQWARTISDFRLLADDDPVHTWFERASDLHNGLGRDAPGYY